MRILFATTNFPPQTGGPSRQALEIVQQLRDRGHEVEVCLSSEAPAECERFGNARRLPRALRPGRLARWLHDWKSARRVMDEFRPDIVHFQVFGGPLCFQFGLAARLRGTPSVVKLTGERSLESAMEAKAVDAGVKGRLKSVVIRALNGALDAAIIAVYAKVWVTSPIFKRRLASRKSASGILMIPNFIDLTNFERIAKSRGDARRPGAAPLILTLCRLRPWKGLSTLISAAALLKTSGFDFVWRVYGDGPSQYRERLEREAAELDVADRLTFCPPIGPTEVDRAYADADAFVLLSEYEPFGIVLVEAMASGVPVLATATGGIPFVVGEALSDRLVPTRAPEAVAARLIETLMRPNTAGIAEGRARASEFGLASGVAKLEAAYREMLADAPGASDARLA